MGLAEVVQWLCLSVAVGFSLAGYFKPIVREKTLKRAFRELEHEVESQWEKVESHLGRISRLKRDLKKSGGPKSDPAAEQLVDTPKSNANDSRSALLKNWKMKHAQPNR